MEEVSTPDTVDGLDWRTRMRYHVDVEGRCRAAGSSLASGDRGARGRLPDRFAAHSGRHRGRAGRRAAKWMQSAGTDGDGAADRRPARVRIAGDHRARRGRTFAVAANGFWQVHPAAADTLVAAVLTGLEPRSGERVAGPLLRCRAVRGGAARPRLPGLGSRGRPGGRRARPGECAGCPLHRRPSRSCP